MLSTISREKSKTIPKNNRANTSRRRSANMLSRDGSQTMPSNSSGKIRPTGKTTPSNNGKIRTGRNSTRNNSNARTRTIGKTMPSNSNGGGGTPTNGMDLTESGATRASGEAAPDRRGTTTVTAN